MTEKSASSKRGLTVDWLVKGILTKLGDAFDRLTGRGWQPSSSLATSELVERLKDLLDAEAKVEGKNGVFVPHIIKLKMQWDKFSTDSEKSMTKLENELLTAAIDHINDKRYYTHAPLSIEVKPDYFTPGVQMLVSFEKLSGDEHEAAVNVSIPGMSAADFIPPEEKKSAPPNVLFTARFSVNEEITERKLNFIPSKRLSVGRTKENDLVIDDKSVSKIHASLVLNQQDEIIVADTGSTNGTFINEKRISYGKSATIAHGEKVKFGAVEVEFERLEEDRMFQKTEGLDFSESKLLAEAESVPIPAPSDKISPVQFDFDEQEKKVETDAA